MDSDNCEPVETESWDKLPLQAQTSPKASSANKHSWIILRVNLGSGEWHEAVGEFEKPNPPTPFPCREGGAELPSPLRGRAGGGVRPLVNFLFLPISPSTIFERNSVSILASPANAVANTYGSATGWTDKTLKTDPP